jgi:hypothetical protein
MIDFTTIRLNETLYRERLQAAAEARQRRAIWVAAPSPIDRLRQAIGKRLINLGHRIQPHAARANVYR